MQVAAGWMAEAGVYPLPREGVSGKIQEPPDAATRLVALARAGAPLRRAIAAIAGRLVLIRGWERLGFARLRDYALERIGVSPRQLQELTHVDAALRERGLAGTETAFVEGRLTWTKLRLLCRVATAEDEGRWIALAEQINARALAREVRAIDARALEAGGAETDEDGREEALRETVFLCCTPAVRAKWHRARFLASRQSGQSIPAWAVAEAVAAEVLSALPLDTAASSSLERAEGCAPESSPESDAISSSSGHGSRRETANGCAAQASGTRSPAVVACDRHVAAFLGSLTDGLADVDPFELDVRLRRAISLEQRLDAELGPLLLTAARERRYRSYGSPSLGAFAREWLGMSPRKAEALLRLERACVVCPPLREAYRTGRLSWAKAQILVRIVVLDHSEPWRSGWVRRAASVTVRRLDDDVERALATGQLDPNAAEDSGVRLEPDPQMGAPPTELGARQQFFFNAPRDAARLFRAVLATTQRRLERFHGCTSSESEALDAMLEHAFEAWGLWNSKVRAEHRVFDRDGWRCSVPGCSSSRNLQDHHIRFRSAGGSDDLANRTTLCAWHHLRGVHAGTVCCAGVAPGHLRFELGVRPGRSPLVSFVSGDRLASGCRP